MKAVRFAAIVLLTVVSLASSGAYAGGKWSVSGTFVEGCSCMGVCPCELTGLKDGCDGVGALMVTSGNYQGVDLSGSKIVYASTPGQWVRLYVETKDSKQNHAARDFASSYFSGFGKVEDVKDAKIDISGKDGKYMVSVDNGAIMKLETEPVLGGDKKTPITHTNTHSMLNPTVMQGKTISGSYKDGERSFTLEGSNSYFNPRVKSSGMF
jgi:hypothetical protein